MTFFNLENEETATTSVARCVGKFAGRSILFLVILPICTDQVSMYSFSKTVVKVVTLKIDIEVEANQK